MESCTATRNLIERSYCAWPDKRPRRISFDASVFRLDAVFHGRDNAIRHACRLDVRRRRGLVRRGLRLVPITHSHEELRDI